MPKQATKKGKSQSQRDAFIETAREHGADMTEDQFKEVIRKIVPKGKRTTKK